MTGRNAAMRPRQSVHQSIQYMPYSASSIGQQNLQASCRNSLSFVQRMGLLHTFNLHNGCVNTVNWNGNGTLLVSGSDDNHLVITEAKNGRVLVKSKTQHKRHIFSARFMPFSSDTAVVSCSGEGLVVHTQFLVPFKANSLVTDTEHTSSIFSCHKFGSTFDVLPLPDIRDSFLSCGEDATVRFFDLRESTSCSERMCQNHILVSAPCAVTAMDVAPISRYTLAAGCSDSIVRLYDRRMLAEDPQPLKVYPIPIKYTRQQYRPTCVKFSPDESELLVSYSMEQIYLFDLKHAGYNDKELLESGCYTQKVRRDDDWETKMPRLRFRGDWSDTGPSSLIVAEQGGNNAGVAHARSGLEPGVLSRLSDEIFRTLNSQRRQALNPNESRTVQTGQSENNTETRPNTTDTVESETVSDGEHVTRASNFGSSERSTSIEPQRTSNPQTEINEQFKLNKHQTHISDFCYVKMSFSGHRNSRTVLKAACFWGDDFIMSGSDCGHIFVWKRQTGKVVKTLLADNRVVNRVQPHPSLPYLASSGIDYNVKLWAPIESEPQFNEVECTRLIKSNEIMLVETRDTITVPAQIMIRILASLHQYRRLMHNTVDTGPSTSESAVVNPQDNVENDENP
ncbi:hypothetical protein KR018_001661 [Drosophila ironensis]|nr:hypothetical protein KR018_001661 [Drosophila ironensis]